MSRKRAPQPPVEFSERWLCQTCEEPKPERSQAEFIQHLRDRHQLPPKGSRSLLLHLDEARAYHSTYEWAFRAEPDAEPVKASQFITGPRGGRR